MVLMDRAVILPKNNSNKQKSRDQEQQTLNSEQSLKIFRNIPFWIWDKETHKAEYAKKQGFCCFNHVIGLPQKEHLTGKKILDDGVTEQYVTELRSHPIYDFQKELIDSVETNRYVFLLKATGLGATEIYLRYMSWLCLRDDRYQLHYMIVVTGPAQELALKHIKRVQEFFNNEQRAKRGATTPILYQPVAVGEHIMLNKCMIQAYPSHNFERARGLDKAVFFLVDEFDFFPPGQRRDARTIPERYIGKSSPYIVLVTTPDKPGSLAEELSREPEATCRYKRLYFNYEKGLNKIYTPFEIEEAKKTKDFEREYNLSFSSGTGNIFSLDIVNKAIQEYDLSFTDSGKGKIIISCDPAYGSSKFAIIVSEVVNGLLYIKIAEQFDRPDPEAMIQRIGSYYSMFGARAKILSDSARPEILDGLKRRGFPATEVVFSKELDRMVMKSVQAMAKNKVRIHPSHKDLIAQLKSVTYDEKGHPNKKELSFDLGDAFIENVSAFEFNELKFIDLGKF